MMKRPSDHVAHAVRRRRDDLGWSARRLAEECERLGAPELTAAVIANIEHGRPDQQGRRRREVSVDELLVLAYALAIPPLLLLVPLGDRDDDDHRVLDDEYPIVPSVTVHPRLAWRIIVGSSPPVDSNRHAVRLKDWRPAATTVRLHERLTQAQTAVDKAHSEARLAEMAQDDDRHRRARAQYVKTLEQLAEILDLFVDAGLRPPPLHPEVVADLRGAGAVRHPEALRVRDLLDWELEDHRGEHR